MDPSIVFDCEKVLPNRFALTLAAAARSRALNRGQAPRLALPAVSTVDLALHEIAAGAFTKDELGPFLPCQETTGLLPPPVRHELRGTRGVLRRSLMARSFTDDRHRGTARQ